jgi:GR25 family glycosyltransferase involved in LPS biosynthesis
MKYLSVKRRQPCLFQSLLLLVLGHLAPALRLRRDAPDFKCLNDSFEVPRDLLAVPSKIVSSTEAPKIDMHRAKVNIAGIIYINVNATSRRGEHIKTHLTQRSFNIPVYRFQAIRPKDLDHINILEWSNGVEQNVWDSERVRNGTHAVRLSHLMAMKWAMEMEPQGERPYLIVEDDVSLRPDWDHVVRNTVTRSPDDWDMLKVAFWGERRCSDKVNDAVYEGRRPFYIRNPTTLEGHYFYAGLTAYLVKPKSVAKILACTKDKDLMNVDELLLEGEHQLSPCFKVYAAAELAGHVAADLGSERNTLR